MWEIIENGEVVTILPVEVLPNFLLNFFGDEVAFRIKENKIFILEGKWEQSHSDAVSEGMMRKNIEKYREEGNYISKAGYKYCTACKQSLPIAEFGKRSNSKDGLARQCKKCVTKKAKKYRRRKAMEIEIKPLPVDDFKECLE